MSEFFSGKQQQLTALQHRVEQRISSFLSESSLVTPFEQFFSHMKEFAENGGKRVRSTLLLSSYLGYAEPQDSVVEAAVALELLHTFMLVHDDIIDESETRRSHRTLHKKYALEAKNHHFGVSSALLAGDLFLIYVFDILNRIDNKQVFDCFMDAILASCRGEISDLYLSTQSLEDVDAESSLRMLEDKTAHYTACLPLCIGSILGNASQEDTATLKRAGRHIGLAFQLQDDILGLVGNHAATGKSNMDDVLEGKKTLLIKKTYEFSNDEGRVFLNKVVGNPEITEREFLAVQNMATDCGAVAYCQKLVDNHYNTAIADFDTLAMRPEMKSVLVDFLHAVMQRKK